MATELLLLSTWSYQKPVGHAAGSPGLLVFWALALLIIGLVPVSVSLFSDPKKAGIPNVTPAGIPPTDLDSVDLLTEREREIYEHLKAGKKLTEIAELCTIEYGTVTTHTRHTYRKFGVSSREELPLTGKKYPGIYPNLSLSRDRDAAHNRREKQEQENRP